MIVILTAFFKRQSSDRWQIMNNWNNPDWDWITGMVCGLISIMAIVALAIIINYYCKAQPTKTHGFLMAGDYHNRFKT